MSKEGAIHRIFEQGAADNRCIKVCELENDGCEQGGILLLQ